MFDYLVFIGRFQPFHVAHRAVIKEALQRSKSVIILLGSAQPERTTKNMFSLAERQHMIGGAFNEAEQSRIHFAGLIDVYNDEKWTVMVKQAVKEIVGMQHKDNAFDKINIGLIGHFKDHSSYYLALFPEWPLVELENYFHLSATPLREAYLQGQLPSIQQVPASTLDFLKQFQHTDTFKQLQLQFKAQLGQQLITK